MDEPRHARKAIRFPLEAPIEFWWSDGGIEKKCEGRTRDISEKGAFILASTCPPAGTQIGFKVFLPELSAFQPKTRMEAVGQVLRVEENRGGFAILTRHTLLRVNKNARQGENGGVNQS